MKTFLVFMLLAISIIAKTQESDLPEKIENSFKAKYPMAKVDNWIFEDNTYSFEFYLKSSMYTAVFNPDGSWQETSEVISDTDIPGLLKDYINKTYPAAKISYTEKVDCFDGNKYIRVCFTVNYEEIKIISSPDGKNIKKIDSEKNT